MQTNKQQNLSVRMLDLNENKHFRIQDNIKMALEIVYFLVISIPNFGLIDLVNPGDPKMPNLSSTVVTTVFLSVFPRSNYT